MTEADLAAIENVERRRFLQAGLTIAWATPVILTLGASPASAQSCVPLGGACDACGDISCCVPAGQPYSCCCASTPNCPDPAPQVCRTPQDCQNLFGGTGPENDACYLIEFPGGGAGASLTSMRTSAARKRKYK